MLDTLHTFLVLKSYRGNLPSLIFDMLSIFANVLLFPYAFTFFYFVIYFFHILSHFYRYIVQSANFLFVFATGNEAKNQQIVMCFAVQADTCNLLWYTTKDFYCVMVSTLYK